MFLGLVCAVAATGCGSAPTTGPAREPSASVTAPSSTVTPAPTATAASSPKPHGVFTPTGSITGTSQILSVTLLADHTVLVLGQDGPAQIYDPVTGAFHAVSAPPDDDAVLAAPLGDGRALVVPYQSDSGAYLYDPATASFSTTGATRYIRQNGAAVALDASRSPSLTATDPNDAALTAVERARERLRKAVRAWLKEVPR